MLHVALRRVYSHFKLNDLINVRILSRNAYNMYLCVVGSEPEFAAVRSSIFSCVLQ